MAETIGELGMLTPINPDANPAAMKPMAETIGELFDIDEPALDGRLAAMKPMAETIGEQVNNEWQEQTSFRRNEADGRDHRRGLTFSAW